MVIKNTKSLFLIMIIFFSVFVVAEEVDPEPWVQTAQLEFPEWYSDAYHEYIQQHGRFNTFEDQMRFRKDAWTFFIETRRLEIDSVLDEVTPEDLLKENLVEVAAVKVSDRIKRQILKSGVPEKAFSRALSKMGSSRVKKRDRLVIIDFSKPATQKRFYYINLKSGSVEKHRVAHGKNSGGKGAKATSFSSKSGSNKTPPGFHVTLGLGEYRKKWQSRYLLLDGIESSNRNSRAREIISHGARYVAGGGRSNGCPALEPSVAKRLFPILTGGVLWYHYTGK